MRDIFKVFTVYRNNRGAKNPAATRNPNTNYSLVSTCDSPSGPTEQVSDSDNGDIQISAGRTLNSARLYGNSINPYGNSTTSPLVRHQRPSLCAIDVLNRIVFKGNLSGNGNKTKCVLLTMLIGLTAISLGALLMVFSPYKIIFAMKTTFMEGGEAFELWQKPPADVYLKVYLFNVTNRDAFMAGKEKLNVVEVGPYVYRELSEHANATINAENHTISAVPLYPLEFIQEKSNGREDDVLILPNVAHLSISNVVRNSFLKTFGLNTLISQTGSQPLIEQTAKEFMFGYQSPLVTLGNTVLPSWIKFEKLGLIDRMYDFQGDVSTTFTGTNDSHLTGLFASYNREQHLTQWKAPCNKVEGASDGTKFPTKIHPNETLWFYRKSLCRSIPLIRTKDEPFTIDGIPSVHYYFKNNSLDNGAFDTENKCFCREDQCLPSGLIDVTHCYYGFPIALSYPHFYMADPKLREDINGSNPEPSKHETYFFINPDTGTPTKVSVKTQINIALGDLSSITRSKQFSNLVVPLLWTNIEMQQLPLIITVKLYLLLKILPITEIILLYLFLIGGVSFIMLSICALIVIPQSDKLSDAKIRAWHKDHQKNTRVKMTNDKIICDNNQDSVTVAAASANFNKKRLSTQKIIDDTNKEMDVYYCSLLAASSSSDQDEENGENNLNFLSSTE